MEKDKRGDRNGESNDSPEIPDRGGLTSPAGLPSGDSQAEMPTARSTLLNEKPI